MRSFHIYLDSSMLRNVLATDFKESRELLTPALIAPLSLLAVVPIIFLWRIRIARAYLAESNRVAYGIDAVFDTDDFGRCHAVISGHVRTDEKSSRSAILDYTGNYLVGLPKALTGSSITQSAEKYPLELMPLQQSGPKAVGHVY
jgi:lipid A ethanolaminephosphotransferase